MVVSPTLLPFITVSKMGSISYNPQQVMRQLGYDQSAIQITGGMGCSDFLTAESQFVGQDKEHIVSKFHTIYWPDVVRVVVRSPAGSTY